MTQHHLGFVVSLRFFCLHELAIMNVAGVVNPPQKQQQQKWSCPEENTEFNRSSENTYWLTLITPLDEC